MQIVLIHICLVTILVTMVVLASDSDILIFRQCSIFIVYVSASSWTYGNRCNISTSITWDRFLSTSLEVYLSAVNWSRSGVKSFLLVDLQTVTFRKVEIFFIFFIFYFIRRL